ncbi:MAG: hypothetical protein ACQKBY_11905 [Verrucomicrobiales bacterium]
MTSFLTLACSVCAEAFKHGDGADNAAGWAIFFMLCVIVPMALGIAFFIIRMARRESRHLDDKYQDDFVLESATN